MRGVVEVLSPDPLSTRFVSYTSRHAKVSASYKIRRDIINMASHKDPPRGRRDKRRSMEIAGQGNPKSKRGRTDSIEARNGGKETADDGDSKERGEKGPCETLNCRKRRELALHGEDREKSGSSESAHCGGRRSFETASRGEGRESKWSRSPVTVGRGDWGTVTVDGGDWNDSNSNSSNVSSSSTNAREMCSQQYLQRASTGRAHFLPSSSASSSSHTPSSSPAPSDVSLLDVECAEGGEGGGEEEEEDGGRMGPEVPRHILSTASNLSTTMPGCTLLSSSNECGLLGVHQIGLLSKSGRGSSGAPTGSRSGRGVPSKSVDLQTQCGLKTSKCDHPRRSWSGRGQSRQAACNLPQSGTQPNRGCGTRGCGVREFSINVTRLGGDVLRGVASGGHGSAVESDHVISHTPSVEVPQSHETIIID